MKESDEDFIARMDIELYQNESINQKDATRMIALMWRGREGTGASGSPEHPEKPSADAMLEELWDTLWRVYPSRGDHGNPKKPAYKLFLARLREGATPDDLLKAAHGYRKHCDTERKTGGPYVMQATTFFGPNERWKEYLKPPDKPKSDNNLSLLDW